MRSILPIVACIWLCGLLPAQNAESEAPPALTAAIEGLGTVSRSDVAAYGRAVRGIAAFDHPAATAALLQELDQAETSAKEAVVRVLGQRQEAFEPLRRLLLRDDTADRLRRLAAEALGRLGSQGIDLLLDLAAKETTMAVHEASIDGLGAAKDERAWRGLAALAAGGSSAQRLRILRLLDEAQGVSAVTKVRAMAVDDADPLLAAVAFRQLSQEGWSRARDRLDELLDRVGMAPAVAVRAELVQGMAPLLDKALYEPFVRLAASDATVVRQAVRKVAARAVGNADFVRWLASEGLELEQPAEREAVILLLHSAPAPAIAGPLARVRARLQRPDRAALELALGLHDLLRRDPGWKQDLLGLARSHDTALRTAGLTLLLELNADDAVDIAQQSLGAKEWELRSIAYRYLGQLRATGSIPLLIARVDRETGRLQQEVSDSLFLLTGRRFFQRANWERWWQKSKADFTLPPIQAVVNSAGSGGGSTISYFDIPLVSNRVAFLLDISGSMSAHIGTDHKHSRLDEARQQLRRVVEALPENYHCNLVIYQSSVRAVWERLQKARAKAKDELLGEIGKLRPVGGTNIHDALELAFRDTEVDTIYLLTDGQPSAGKITDVQDLADEVRRWNRTRQIVIHGIAIGAESELLKRLAAESGGSYVCRR